MSDASVGKRLLFLTDVWTVGGIERVTVTLANALAARGWEVAVAIEAVADGTLLGDLAPAIRVVTLAGRNRAERTASLRRALRELKVGVLVNQRAHQYKKSRMAHLAARGLGVRVVEALHASIGFDERTLDASGLRRRWRAWKTRRHYRLTYARCDAFVVLSERLIPELRRFAGLRETTKCVAIANPLTLTPAPGPKAKRLLYVGRLCEREKRVSRVLEVWGRLAARFPEWRLDVVGDGPDRAALERLAQGLPVRQSCVDTLAEKYFCHSYEADFSGDNAGANQAVRNFIKKQTNGLIDRDFRLTEQTYFAVINTLYLKDLWNGAGDDLPLTDAAHAFTRADGSVYETPLLRGHYASGRPQAGEGCTYFFAETAGRCRLLFLLPDEGHSVQEIFTEENIARAIACTSYGDYNEDKTEHYNTRCLFPAFSADYDADLRALLREQFGIRALFDDAACDLSALLGRASAEGAPYACTGITHVTKLEVDRGGIEGAAATVVANGATSAEPDPAKEVYLDFVVDRAFGFAIVDASGNTLFAGAVESLA